MMETDSRHTEQSARTIQASLDLHHWFNANNPRGFTFQPLPDHPVQRAAALKYRMRHRLAFAHFDLGIDHHAAIVHLCKEHFRSSAFPVARSLFDATWKGAWVAFAAPPDLLDKYTQGNHNPKPNAALKVMSRLKSHELLYSLAPFLTKVFEDAYDHLSDYSHAGLLQIGRWLGQNEIGPKHTDEEMEEVLRLSDKLAACCGIFLADICDTDRAEVFTHLAEIITD